MFLTVLAGLKSDSQSRLTKIEKLHLVTENKNSRRFKFKGRRSKAARGFLKDRLFLP